MVKIFLSMRILQFYPSKLQFYHVTYQKKILNFKIVVNLSWNILPQLQSFNQDRKSIESLQGSKELIVVGMRILELNFNIDAGR